MNRFIFLIALACVALAPAGQPAAQPASAVGTPLPDASMSAGTITVRVVAGTPAVNVADAEVTLIVNGQPRTAKSDGSGRATFRDLPVGATVQATIVDEQQKVQSSSSFPVPPQGGTALMLSTKPFTGAPASHGVTAGAGAQAGPAPRAMSGQPRQDRMMPPGSYQVLLTYNNASVKNGAMTDPQPPVGEKITLVGYRSDDTVDIREQAIDATGRTTFTTLDVSGHTTYFALARLPRAGAIDRLMAAPVAPDPQAGSKLILSSDKRDSQAPQIDEPMMQLTPTPAGKVRVSIEGVPVTTEIKLVDVATKAVLGTAVPGPGAPDPRKIEGQAPFTPAPDLPPGAVAIKVHGGPGTVDTGLPDVPIRIIPSDQPNLEGVSSKTGPDGTVQMQAPVDKPQRAVFNVNGKDLVSQPFEVAQFGGRLDVYVHWEGRGRPEAIFDVPYKPELVIYAETRATLPGAAKEELFRSWPVQLVPNTGVHLQLTTLPRVITTFRKIAGVEDELLWVHTTYGVQNQSMAPYSAGPDGMVIPLPKGFRGAKIADQYQHIASIAPGEGIRLVRPIEPGGTQFVVTYSLGSEGGELEWKQDIKQPLFGGRLEIRLHGDMVVKPRGAQGRLEEQADGSQRFVIENIRIPPDYAMELKVLGMPAPPGWRVWTPRLIGLLVLGMIVAGAVFALIRKPAPVAPGVDKRRTALLDELVELERTGKDPARREQVLADLERLWRE